MPDIVKKKSKKKPGKKTEILDPRKAPGLGDKYINEELLNPPEEKKQIMTGTQHESLENMITYRNATTSTKNMAQKVRKARRTASRKRPLAITIEEIQTAPIDVNTMTEYKNYSITHHNHTPRGDRPTTVLKEVRLLQLRNLQMKSARHHALISPQKRSKRITKTSDNNQFPNDVHYTASEPDDLHVSIETNQARTPKHRDNNRDFIPLSNTKPLKQDVACQIYRRIPVA